MDAARAVPGITSVGTGRNLPFGGWNGTAIALAGQSVATQEENPRLGLQVIAGDYFQSLEQPLAAGRVFTPQDDLDAPRVALLNRRAAQTLWPNGNPIGQRIERLTIENPFAT